MCKEAKGVSKRDKLVIVVLIFMCLVSFASFFWMHWVYAPNKHTRNHMAAAALLKKKEQQQGVKNRLTFEECSQLLKKAQTYLRPVYGIGPNSLIFGTKYGFWDTRLGNMEGYIVEASCSDRGLLVVTRHAHTLNAVERQYVFSATQ